MKKFGLFFIFLAFLTCSCEEVDTKVDRFLDEHTCYWCNQVGRVHVQSNEKIFCSERCWTEYNNNRNSSE